MNITVVELREQLVHANVTFATEIIDVQENINESLNQLVSIVSDVEEVGYDPTEYYKMNLIPPIVLILQMIEMTLSSVGNIMGIFQSGEIKFDPYYFLEKYIPYIDWDDFRSASDEYLRKKTVKEEVINTDPNTVTRY